MRLAFALLLSSTILFGQETAQISGLVTDASNAVVPNVAVSIKRIDTASEVRTFTNSGGRYAFSALPPGKYSLELKKDGFQTAVANDVELHVADRQELDFDLTLGAVSQTITVTGSTPLVNTSDGAVSTVVDRRFVDSLPMNGRTFQALIALTPGVVFTSANTTTAGQFVVNGQRADTNYFSVDGVSANAGTTNGAILSQAGGQLPALSALGGTNSLVSMDAMEEFRIQTSSFAPEFGRTPGAQVSIVTRSGGNQFHGTLFEYFRNDALNANNWFSNANRLAKAKERQSDFGGVFGGPILKNRTFFFFSYEGQRVLLPITQTTTVPTLAIRQAAPASQQPFLNAIPLPNGDTLAGGVGVFAATVSNPSNLDATSIRIDQKLGEKLVLFGRYNHSPSGNTTGVSAPSVTKYTIDTGTAGLTATLSPHAVNELRFNYTRTASIGFSPSATLGGAVPFGDSLGFPTGLTAANARLNYFITGGYSVGYGVSGGTNIPSLNLTDSLSLTRGTHQFKLGVDWRRITPSATPPPTLTATFSGLSASPGGVLSGIASSVVNNNIVGGTLLDRNLSFYVQDTWRLTRRLTLTYGLRWDINPPAKGLGDANALYPLVNIESAATISLGPRGADLYRFKRDNFAPRVGVSYRLHGDAGHETVLRGGFGNFYDSTTAVVGSAVGSLFPFGTAVTYTSVPFPLTPAQATLQPIRTTPPVSSAFSGPDPNLTTPYTWQYNVSVEQALGGSQSLTVGYVGAAGRALYKKFRYTTPNASFLNNVQVAQNAGSSDYNALQVKYQRRLSSGLQVLASWTWSHSIDNSSDDQTVTLTPNAINPNIDRGSSDYDVRHVATAALSYGIPSPIQTGLGRALLGGWSVESLFTYRTALPVSLIGSTANINGTTFNSRPDVVPGVAQYLYGSQYPGGMVFNKAAFVSAGVTRQGNMGRNVVRGFGLVQENATLQRQFRVTERVGLQFRTELFNIFNHPNFGAPTNSLTSALFGLATGTLNVQMGGLNALYQTGGPRSVQLALRLTF